MSKTVFLVAGGTGGHAFPALALAETLRARGFKTEFIADSRTADIYKKNGVTPHVNIVGRMDRGLIGKIKGAFGIGAGMMQAMDLYREHDPVAVVGFGGYPSYPAVLAAQILKIPTFLHEQNAVFGRANRMLMKRAAGIALSFENTAMIEKSTQVRHTGNPVRGAIVSRDFTYRTPEKEFRLLVTGGSQGSRVFNMVPQALSMLPTDLRERLIVVQQARAEDIDTVATAYNKMGVTARLEPFFTDMPDLLASSHLIIARAGASTVAELAIAGRPAIFVPLAASLDGDQAQNALQMQQNGAAWVVAEKDFTPASLSAKLAEIMQDPGLLSKAAEAARKSGRADAADRLADLVTGGTKR